MDCCHGQATRTLDVLHPLRPLSPEEIRKAVSIVRTRPELAGLAIETVELKEPDKAAYRAGSPVPREARVNLFSLHRLGVTRTVVDLDAGAVTAVTEAPDARPMIQLEQFTEQLSLSHFRQLRGICSRQQTHGFCDLRAPARAF